MGKKYEILKDDKINFYGHTLYRIKALRKIGFIEEGTVGGYIESEENLSQDDNFSFVGGDAKVFGKSYIYDNAVICKNAIIKDLMIGGALLACGNTIMVGGENGTDLDYSTAVICDSACIKFLGTTYGFGNNSVIGGDIVMVIDKDKTFSISSGEMQKEKFVIVNLENKKLEE